MQLMCHSNGGSRTISVFTNNEVRFTAARVISFKGIGTMEQDDHIRILF